MNKGSEKLKSVLEAFKNMSVEEYNTLYEAASDETKLMSAIDDFFKKGSPDSCVEEEVVSECSLQELGYELESKDIEKIKTSRVSAENIASTIFEPSNKHSDMAVAA